jgi:hypothetical protein
MGETEISPDEGFSDTGSCWTWLGLSLASWSEDDAVNNELVLISKAAKVEQLPIFHPFEKRAPESRTGEIAQHSEAVV